MEELKRRYEAAAESIIEKIKDDVNVLAVIVSGSLAYDVIWEKSDIDMTLIVRDQVLKNDSYCLTEDGITVNVYLVTRSMFRREMEKSVGLSFDHSYYAKSKMVYYKDESLYEFFEELKNIGEDDIALSAFNIAAHIIYIYEKGTKWLKYRKDPLYAQYYVLKGAEAIASMELCLKGMPLGRDLIQKAMAINEGVVKPFYIDPMKGLLSEREILDRLNILDKYLMEHIDVIKKPVIEYMADGEIKTLTILANKFHQAGHFIINVFDFLAEKGIIEKVSQTIRITPKGKQIFEEIGYIYIP